MKKSSEPRTIHLSDGRSVSALLVEPLCVPLRARALFVFAHGAGAGMDHPFMHRFAVGLAARDIATLRYQFVFMEEKTGRPDRPQTAHAVVRAAVATAAQVVPGVPLYAGGKSFGARMTSQAQALAPLPGVHGLVFVGFPLHPAGKPSTERAAHLADVHCPMLFLQGTRDALATLPLVVEVSDSLGERATLVELADADHAFHVRRSSGTTDDATLDRMLDAMVAWMK